jgi:hypothetical protein
MNSGIGWRYSSLIEHLPHMSKALDSIPITKQTNKQQTGMSIKCNTTQQYLGIRTESFIHSISQKHIEQNKRDTKDYIL